MEAFSYRSLLYLTRDLAAVGALLGLLTALGWFLEPLFRARGRAQVSGTGQDVALEVSTGPSLFLRTSSRLLLVLAFLCFMANLSAQFARLHEVQHWPAQTMYEVIPLGTSMGFLATLILYFVLGLHRGKGIARGFGDLFVAILLSVAALVLHYVLQLDPSGRSLPPALQSYWFPTHITAYMFGYFTLFIATLATWLHFSFRFWRGLLQPKDYPVPKRTLFAIAFVSLIPVPFGFLGILLGPGTLALAALPSLLSQLLPNKMAWFDAWEEGSDRFTFLIFAVGFPFLTAGLVQGSLWAQEAWALYWGWDSKEVSAMISWLFYVVYLHLRYVAGWRGEKSMWILLFGGLSIYITFQLFGHLPASRNSLHRYTDMDVVPAEGMMQ